jgi:aspartate aminotransferase
MPIEATRIPERLSLLRPTAVNSILAEARALQSQGRKLVSLMRGEPDFPTPPHIVEAAVSALRSGRTNYPENRGEPALRDAVVHKLARDNGLTYDASSEILITDGATLGLYAALMTLLGPGDEVLVPDPIYDAYRSPISLTGASARPVKSSREGGRFHLTLEALEDAWTPAARVLLINTPWNPVGTVFTRSELEELSEFVCRRDLMLISDEIYESITYENHKHISPASLSPAMRERSVLVNSLSKTYAMTGWRLGYCAAPAETIQRMLLVLQQSSRGPATFVQDAGVAALTGSQDCVRQMRNIYAERRQAALQALSGIPSVDVMAPEGGFFTMLDISRSGRSSDEVRRLLLHEHGVVVIHGRAYGESGEGTLRVSFASGGETLSRGLDLLRKGLETL